MDCSVIGKYVLNFTRKSGTIFSKGLYTPTINVWKFQLPFIFVILIFFCYWYSNSIVLITHCGLNLHFLMINNIVHLLKYSNVSFFVCLFLILKYSWFTNNVVFVFAIQQRIYTHIPFIFFSIMAYHRILNIVLCAIQ